MIQAEYKSDMQNNYMIIKSLEQDKLSYKVNMLFHNELAGFLKIEQRMVDGERFFVYDITSKQPIVRVFEHNKLNFFQVKGIITDIIQIVKLGKEYLLEEDDFVLDPEFIYMGYSGLEVHLCYISGWNQNIRKQLQQVMEYIMNKVDYTDEKAVLISYQLYQVCREQTCSFTRLLGVIENFGKDIRKKDLDYSEEIKVDKINISQDKINLLEKEDENYRTNNRISTNIEEKQRDLKEKNLAQSSKNQESIKIRKTNIKTENNKLEKTLKQEDEILQSEKESNLTKRKNQAVDARQYQENLRNNKMQEVKNRFLVQSLDCSSQELVKEKENFTYSMKIYFQIGAAFIIFLLVGVFLYQSGYLNETYTKQVDFVKVFGFFVLSVTICVYFASKLLKEESKKSVIIPIENKEQRRSKGKKSFVSDKNMLKTNGKSGAIKSEFSNEEERETTILADFTNNKQCMLFAQEREIYEDILLEEFPFFIGKLKTKVNFSLNCVGVSRFHAKIEYQQGDYYIIDLNSTNGTFLNEIKLFPEHREKLKIGDSIRFANIEYIFGYMN